MPDKQGEWTERENAEQWAMERRLCGDRVRCESCLGMGYRGGWRTTRRGRVWKINTCRGCGGTGDREAGARQRPRAARKR